MSEHGEEEEEQDRRVAESSRIGAEGNRISAETDRVMAEFGRDDRAAAARASRGRKDFGQLLAYVMIVAVAAWGLHEVKQTNVAICQAATDNRTAVRNLVLAVDSLGQSLIVEGKPPEKWTHQEKQSMAALGVFRDSQFKLLEVPPC